MKKDHDAIVSKRMRTQWAAQFLAASELIRRGYTVSFTTGNQTPYADLMVGAPSRRQFWVDVKGQSLRGSWLVRPKKKHRNLFYILVYLSPLPEETGDREPDRFFVMTQKQVNEVLRASRRAHPNNKGTMPGFNWGDAHPFEDAWGRLPG